MAYQIFTVPVYDSEQAMADLNRFLDSHQIITVEKHWLENGSYSAWSFCIDYNKWDQRSVGNEKKGKVDYKELLSEAEFPLYVRLRDLRKTIADESGVPVFAIFTNEQLAAMVTSKVSSLSQMGNIIGIGESKLAKYGERFVKELNSSFSTSG